jgi:hypothetical protein
VTAGPVTLRRVYSTWWPLAASWLMMGFELPAVSATMARLPEPEISLAAYGGIVFPLSLLIEAPIIMLLAASTALSRDRDSYRKLRRFMWASGAVLTGIHLAIVVTPLFDLFVGRLIGAPMEIRGPARTGLLIMTLWTWSIAYRRFQQGVLIRYGRSRTVGVGTVIRLTTNVSVLAAGFVKGNVPGIVVGTAAIMSGVIVEAVFVGLAVRPVLEGELPAEDPEAEPLTARRFFRFYTPLALTSVFALIALPIGSAAMSRMPRPIESLAVWPVISGLTFTLRSLGFAYNEVVVALLDRRGSVAPLLRFTILLAGATTLLLALVAATPLSWLWFGVVSGLSPELAGLAGRGLWLTVLMPGMSVVQHWFQGILVNSHHTRGVSEAIALYLGTSATVLALGIGHGGITGLYVGLAATFVGYCFQAGWLRHRSRGTLESLRERDLAAARRSRRPDGVRATHERERA